MTSEAKEQFLAERARALATIILSRRADLTVVDSRRDLGLDLQISIEREDKPMRLTFGVLLRGVMSSLTVEQANKALVSTMGQFRAMRKFTYPVCLFFFTMRDDQAFFSWLAEPVLKGAEPKLIHHEKANCVALTDELLAQVIEQIVAWYDSVETLLIA